MDYIRVENLNYTYSEGMPYETMALKDISFTVAPQSFLGIIGHTGSGKSTVIQQLNGLLKPKSGKIFIGDTEITAKDVKARDVRKKIGLVFQYPEYQLFEETVSKDIAFGPLNLGLSVEETDLRIREALELVGLDIEEIGERSPFELSGGQKRRVAIAGVIAMKPEVLILDEPTAGLDPKAHHEILEMVTKVHEEQKNITILISHNMGDVAKLCDKVLVLEKGSIAFQGTPKEVFFQSERLASLGLDVPPATGFINKLRNKGLEIEGYPLILDEAEEAIAKLLGEIKEQI